MENPNYYAIIPASVRYDSKLSANAKLLFGEITALTSKEGYCWASNAYFAKLYGISLWQVSRLISSLKKQGHLNIVVAKNYQRRIFLTVPFAEKRKGVGQKAQGGFAEKRKKVLQGNNTNKIRPSEQEEKQSVIIPTQFLPTLIEERRKALGGENS